MRKAHSDGLSGETSIQHMYQKIAIIESITNAMKPFRPDTILLIAANPVDVITSFAQEHSGLPASQVLGSGTFLDSIRLRGILADQAGVRDYCFPGCLCGVADSKLGRRKCNGCLHGE